MTPSSRFLRKNIATSDEMNTINEESLKSRMMVLVYFVFVRLPKLVEKIRFETGHIFSIWMKIHSLVHLNPAFSPHFVSKIMILCYFLAISVTLWKNVPRSNTFSQRVLRAWPKQNILGPSTLQALSILGIYFTTRWDIFSQKSRRRCQ